MRQSRGGRPQGVGGSGLASMEARTKTLSPLLCLSLPLPLSFFGTIGPEHTQDSCPSASACASVFLSLIHTHTHTHTEVNYHGMFKTFKIKVKQKYIIKNGVTLVGKNR